MTFIEQYRDYRKIIEAAKTNTLAIIALRDALGCDPKAMLMPNQHEGNHSKTAATSLSYKE